MTPQALAPHHTSYPGDGALFLGGVARRALCCDIWVLSRPWGPFRPISQHTSSGSGVRVAVYRMSWWGMPR